MEEYLTLARPYAQAAFMHANETNALIAWQDMLVNASLIVSDPSAQQFIFNPSTTVNIALEFFRGFSSGKTAIFTKDYLNFINILLSSKRLELLPYISTLFTAMKDNAENTVNITVVTACDLTEKQTEQLTTKLVQKLQARTIKLATQIDPALLGGAIIKYGDTVIDDSLQGKLNQLTHALVI